MPRHFSHPVNTWHLFDAGVRSRAAGTASRRGVRNCNDPATRPIDLLDAFYGRASRQQVCAFDEIVCRAKSNALGALSILRHEGKIAVTISDRIGHLAGIVVDLKSQRQL